MCVLPRGATQSLGYALWDACSVLAARGLVVAGASLGRHCTTTATFRSDTESTSCVTFSKFFFSS